MQEKAQDEQNEQDKQDKQEDVSMTTEPVVIDCDGHILEPPDLWETYLDPKYRDRALRIRVGDDGVQVATADAQVLVKRVRPEGGRKVPAAEWAAAAGLREGSRLK